MTDDLVGRLRDYEGDNGHYATMREAADRIEQLEAALKKIAQHDLQAIALDALRPGERAALEGKDDR